MKAKLDAIIQQDQAEYLDQLLTQKDSLLAEMEAYAAEHRVPIADREVARFIEITARAFGCAEGFGDRNGDRLLGGPSGARHGRAGQSGDDRSE